MEPEAAPWSLAGVVATRLLRPERGRSALASRGSWGISSGLLRSAAATREVRACDIVRGD